MVHPVYIYEEYKMTMIYSVPVFSWFMLEHLNVLFHGELDVRIKIPAKLNFRIHFHPFNVAFFCCCYFTLFMYVVFKFLIVKVYYSTDLEWEIQIWPKKSDRDEMDFELFS